MAATLLKAIQLGTLEDIDTCLGHLSSEELSKLLPDHSVEGLPTFHYLARFTSRKNQKEQCILDNVISTFVKFGYDINKTTDEYRARKRASLGFTALLAATEQQNLTLIECLLRHGARTDIRDSRGYSPSHWAIIVGNLKCLERLVEAGATVESTEQERDGIDDVHPLLHTAVDEGRTEIVFYLLNKGLVDCNEEAVYRGILTEEAFTQFPSRYNNQPDSLKTVDISFTALGRAVRMRKISILEYLLTIEGIKLSGFNELHFCIVEGDTELACLLQSYFSNEELCNDKINDRWALHCLHPKAFTDELRIEKTMQLIRAYIDAGWNVNSVSASGFNEKIKFPSTLAFDEAVTPDADSYHFYSFRDYTLLHLACFYRSLPIIECLVDEGADINCKTGGSVKVLLPLQILLLFQQFDTAIYLIEKGADVMAVGQLKMYLATSKFMMKVPGAPENEAYHVLSFTSLELLLRMQYLYEKGLGALDAMLKVAVLQGPKEFHMAVQGGNPEVVLKLLQHCIQKCSKDDLTWMNTAFMPQSDDGCKVPSLVWLMHVILEPFDPSSCSPINEFDAPVLIDLIKLMVEHGYDCNQRYAVEYVAKDKDASLCDNVVTTHRSDPLIFFIISLDFNYEFANELLKTLLEFDHLQQNVKNAEGKNPVEFVLQLYDQRCLTIQNKNCWKLSDEVNHCYEAVKLLVNNGVDVSEMVVDDKFRYHYGYKQIMQLLYCAGAKIHPTFLDPSTICHEGYHGTRPFVREIKELEKWTKKFDEEYKLNMRQICRMKIRKDLKNIADVKMLETSLPRNVKDEVLGMVPV